MTDAELYDNIRRRDALENLAAVRPPTMKDIERAGTDAVHEGPAGLPRAASGIQEHLRHLAMKNATDFDQT